MTSNTIHLQRTIARWAGTLVLPLILSGCTGGDFGRSRMDPTIEAYIGAIPTALGVSESDEERLLHDLVQRYYRIEFNSPWRQSAANVQADQTSQNSNVQRYSTWLQRQNFSSSQVRYTKLRNDIQIDIIKLPPIFVAICDVKRLDERRELAASSLTRTSVLSQQARAEKQLENEANITRFSHTLSFRYASYVWALEQLLLETPHEEARAVDAKLSELAVWVQVANDGQYCTVSTTMSREQMQSAAADSNALNL